MSKKDHEVVLLGGQERDPRSNLNTRGIGVVRPSASRIEFDREFAKHYSGFREHVRRFNQPGVAVVAIDRVNQRVAGVACVAARIGDANALLVGRHSEAHLLLTGDETISLRHMVVMVEPLSDFRPGEGVRYRVMDLRSSQGFQTEDGKTLSALRSDGPAFLASGNYIFYFFVTGDPTDWPDSAMDAWAFIPERIYLEERARMPDGSGLHRSARRFPVPMQKPITLVERVRGPSRADVKSLVREDEERVAELTVIGPDSLSRISVGASAIEDGILFGRSSRCDAAPALQHDHLSRVHLLLISVAGEVYALDTASTNGCHRGQDFESPFALRQLASEDTIYLGSLAAVTWNWVN